MAFPLALIALSILVRWLVAQFPYSGQSSPPMYGDYEAQRHWMEVTVNLPVKDWYNNSTDNDLLYWGLDYPPLTAYHMFAIGQVSSKIFNSTWTELHKSRGLESDEHKLFMRSSVIFSEALIYLPPILYYFYKTPPSNPINQPKRASRKSATIFAAMLLFYPAQILVDHGHFQYNCVFMGLVLWAIIFMIKGKQICSGIAFTLALCYKQMALYYALPFFWFIASSSIRSRPILVGFNKIILMGLIVLGTIGIIFMPYLGSLESTLQVVRRIFPIQRGLFEDKVANFWFILSIFYKLRSLYGVEDLLKASTASTLLLSLPAGLHLLFSPTIRAFKYSLVTTSLVFFMFSFQVHEKTILVPALAVMLLAREHPQVANWFVIISTFSLQPLLIKDGQLLPYFILLTIYTLFALEIFREHITITLDRLVSIQNLSVIIYLSSILTCFILSLATIFVEPPKQYPHIHATINAIYSGGHFTVFLLYFYYKQLANDGAANLKKTN